MQAAFGLVDGSKDLFRKTLSDLEAICGQLDMSLEDLEITIDKSFF